MKTISKSQYLLLKMRENYETNLKNETVEITDEEYDNLIQYKNIKYDNNNLEGAKLVYDHYTDIRNIIYGEHSYQYENSVYLLNNDYDDNDWFIVFNDGTFKRIDNSELLFKLKNNIGELKKYKDEYEHTDIYYTLYYIYPDEIESNVIQETIIASYKGLTCEFCNINVYKSDYSFNFENQKVYTGPIPTNFLNEYIETNEYSNANELRIYIDNYSIYIKICNNDGIFYYTLSGNKYVIQNNEIISIEGGNFKITNFVIDDSHFEGYIEYNNETYQFNLSILKSQSPIIYDNNDDNNFYYVYARGNGTTKIWDNLGNENIGNNFASLTYNRTDEDQHITVYATAKEYEKEVSDVISHEYIISSNKHNEKTDEPTILDPTYANCAISFEIIGNGIINAWDNIGNTYTEYNSLNISYNCTDKDQYITVYATAQEDDKDISYTVSRNYTIPSLSNIKTTPPNIYETRVYNDKFIIEVYHRTNGTVHVWDNLNNNYSSIQRIELTYNRTDEDQYITIYANAQELGKEVSDTVTYELIIKSFINYSIEVACEHDLSQSTIKENKPYSWSTPTIVEQFKDWITYTDEFHSKGYLGSNNLALKTADLYYNDSNSFKQKVYAPYKLYDDPILGRTESSEKCDLIILKNKYYIWDYSNYIHEEPGGGGPIIVTNEFPSDLRIIEYDPQTLELSEVSIKEERIKPVSYKDNKILYINDFDIIFNLNLKWDLLDEIHTNERWYTVLSKNLFIEAANKSNYKYFIGNKGDEYPISLNDNAQYNLISKSLYNYVNIVGNAYKYEYILNEGDIVILDKNLVTINTEPFINTEFILDENGNPLQDENEHYTGETYEHEYKFIPDELKGKITFYELNSETFELTELNIE